MNELRFGWIGAFSLREELHRPIASITAHYCIAGSGAQFVTLWRPDGTGLKVYSKMHDLAERIEVGVLNFELIEERAIGDKTVRFAPILQADLFIRGLSIVESGARAESGISLESQSENVIMIVASAFPYHVAVTGVPLIPGDFSPEHPIEEYARFDLT